MRHWLQRRTRYERLPGERTKEARARTLGDQDGIAVVDGEEAQSGDALEHALQEGGGVVFGAQGGHAGRGRPSERKSRPLAAAKSR